jgi:hypothetical protein
MKCLEQPVLLAEKFALRIIALHAVERFNEKSFEDFYASY